MAEKQEFASIELHYDASNWPQVWPLIPTSVPRSRRTSNICVKALQYPRIRMDIYPVRICYPFFSSVVLSYPIHPMLAYLTLYYPIVAYLILYIYWSIYPCIYIYRSIYLPIYLSHPIHYTFHIFPIYLIVCGLCMSYLPYQPYLACLYLTYHVLCLISLSYLPYAALSYPTLSYPMCLSIYLSIYQST